MIIHFNTAFLLLLLFISSTSAHQIVYPISRHLSPEERNLEMVMMAKYGIAGNVEHLLKMECVDVSFSNHAALIEASRNGHLKAVAVLIRYGAEPRARGYKAVKLAIRKGHWKVALFLIKHAVRQKYWEQRQKRRAEWIEQMSKRKERERRSNHF